MPDRRRTNRSAQAPQAQTTTRPRVAAKSAPISKSARKSSKSPRSTSGNGGSRTVTRAGNGSPATPSNPLRYAVIGLGYISQIAILPAFANAKATSKLSALVSNDDEKLKKLGRRYSVDLLCKYADIDKLFASGAIDAVYIALPNSLHREYAVRAAEAGLHVLCEKPMAVTSRDCERMIEAAQQHRVKLMIAYRLHFDPATLEVAEIAQSGKLGDLRFFTSQFSMQVGADNIRLKREMGGGPLYDIGIYCINAARTVFAAEPVEVMATAVTHNDPRFKEVPETVAVVMKFPHKQIASFTCSFGAADRGVYEVIGTKGYITVDPGYEYAEGLAYEMRIGEKTTSKKFKKSDQFAAELIHFSDCVLNDHQPEPSGDEGLADVRIIEAMNKSILNGKWVALDLPHHKHRADRRQAIWKPGIKPPSLIGVSAPSD
jgi:predicted dehydrogenase